MPVKELSFGGMSNGPMTRRRCFDVALHTEHRQGDLEVAMLV